MLRPANNNVKRRVGLCPNKTMGGFFGEHEKEKTEVVDCVSQMSGDRSLKCLNHREGRLSSNAVPSSNQDGSVRETAALTFDISSLSVQQRPRKDQ